MKLFEHVRAFPGRRAWAILCALLVLPMLQAGEASTPLEYLPPATGETAPMALGLMGGVFAENAGQMSDPAILFYAQSGSAAFLEDSVLLYSLVPHAEVGGPQEPGVPAMPKQDGMAGGHVLRLSFPGSGPTVPVGRGPAQWLSNYFYGNEPASWRTGVRNFREIVYPNLWDGIDMVYYPGGGGIKYDLVVRPGADHSQIRIRMQGQESLSRRDHGTLVAATGLGPGSDMLDSGLVAFHADDPGSRLDARFVLIGQDTYAFDVEGHDSARTLVIDPLIYSTYLGGSDSDYATGIAADTEGCVYIAGYTLSPDFPTTPGAFGTQHHGYTHEAFVVKLNPSGDSLLYSTFIGDVGPDHASAVAVDSLGHAYITGYTGSYDFPTTPGALDRTYNGGAFDAFVAKLGPDGDELLYSTFLGGQSAEAANDIAVDDNGYAYVVGYTWSVDFPTTPGAHNRVLNGALPGSCDAFVTKLSQSGDSLVYSTYLGGNSYEYGNGIAVDPRGHAYVTGYTRSVGFPTTPGAYSRTLNGGIDAFVCKLSRTGNSLLYSTLLGGDAGDAGTAIAVSKWGDAYVTGYTTSADFPVTTGIAHAGWIDAFITRLSPAGDTLVYSTLLGGEGGDYGTGIAVDRAGCAHVTGFTASPDFPTTEGAFSGTYFGGGDAFLVKLMPQGEIRYSTYLGGSASDFGTGITIDSNGYTVVAGQTSSPDFPVTPGSVGAVHNGHVDMFVTRLDLADPAAHAGPDIWVEEGSSALLDGSGSWDNHGITSYTWTFYDGTGNVTLSGPTQVHVFPVPGIFAATLNVTDASGNWGLDIATVTVLDITPPTARACADKLIDEGETLRFNGSASTDNVGIVNHTWRFIYGGRETLLHGESRTFTFRIPGFYRVTLTVADAAGNLGTDVLNVTVRDITPPRAYAGRDRSIRQNTLFTFNGSASTDNVGIVSYTWNFNDGARDMMLHGIAPSHQFGVVGVYPVLLTVTDAAGHWDTDTMILRVLEIVDPVAHAGPDRVVDEFVSMRFDGSASTDNVGVVRWEWTFNDGANDVALYGVSPSWIFTVPGTYVVTLNASDAAGNWDTDTMTVTVLDVTDPVPAPGPNRAVLPGTAVTFDGTGSWDSSGIASYVWTFVHNGTIQELDGPTGTFVFWTPGTYTVTMTVTDSNGNTASGQTTVTVLVPDALEIPTPWNFWLYVLLSSAAMLLLAVIVRFRRGRR